MTEKNNQSPFKLDVGESEALPYIIGVPILIASIAILASLTHLVLHP